MDTTIIKEFFMSIEIIDKLAKLYPFTRIRVPDNILQEYNSRHKDKQVSEIYLTVRNGVEIPDEEMLAAIEKIFTIKCEPMFSNPPRTGRSKTRLFG